ncbi:transcriptional repressor [Sulfurospirillum diekertiae]|jgi:Fur family peroxide stress response transcriptional regulator|uniref:Peroxide-responsive repressor PerR n=1 Tax=Sulfurospirillum diekertiae TaxID=1854492 RepID=A0A290HA84_9BACT|nr:transcriptional repressor [Sulfurospirillum diekertiae]ATB68387.1 peroxide-responsive repressor PerR [Sulfurospirillum diekertiae]QIR76242.1 transcriptional repressor [Sulfurospirillum diekertiae]QIR78873.1 transcriptional repressor [Sulfurospirillum diekertiae]
MNDFINLLKTKELKATPQRISVLKELDKKGHPTIDDLYNALKKENPSMSLATVYKNLATLKEKGVVIEVNTAEGKMRYDIYSKPHIHLVCQQCGSIEDVDYDQSLFEYQTILETNKHVKIDRMDVIATVKECSVCKKK